MGRTPKSPTEKRLTGAGKRSTRAPRQPEAALSVEEATALSASSFPPPPWLTDRKALGVWSRVAPELRRLNMVAPSDRDTLGRYCFHFAGFIATLKAAPIGREYVDVKMTNSEERMPRLHPAVKAREVHERHLIEIEDRFGGSPLARYRLIAQQSAHPGAFGDLFGKPDGQNDGETASAPTNTAAPASPTSPVGVLQPRTLQ